MPSTRVVYLFFSTHYDFTSIDSAIYIDERFTWGLERHEIWVRIVLFIVISARRLGDPGMFPWWLCFNIGVALLPGGGFSVDNIEKF